MNDPCNDANKPFIVTGCCSGIGRARAKRPISTAYNNGVDLPVDGGCIAQRIMATKK